MPKVLSPAEIESYERDGFLAPVEVMSAEEARDVRARLEAAETYYPEAFGGAGRNNAHLLLGFLDAIVRDARVLDAVEDLIGPDILAYGTVIFAKDPGGPGYVSWHQDGAYMGLDPFPGVTAWLALTPSTPESGCMAMIPGSHRLGRRDHLETFAEENILTRGQAIQGVEAAAAVELVLAPGQMSLHHPWVIHGSQPNRGADRRIGFAIQSYVAPSARQVLGAGYAQLVRGDDTYGHFEPLPSPRADMDPGSQAARAEVNGAWAEILYQGAERRRDY
ncbi:MAG: phytanoyl-CoA dioxygenase family protein [Pseudomonadota bacterium]